MKYAIIKNSMVENIIEAEAEFAEQVGAVIAADDTAIGDFYDGSIFSRPVIPAVPTSRPDQIAGRLAEIDMLGSTPRAKREALLGNTQWLAQLDAEAATLRSELANL